MRFVRVALVAVAVIATIGVAAAQPAACQPAGAVVVTGPAEGQRPSPMTASAPAQSGAQTSIRAHRWIDLQTGQVDARYRVINNSAGMRTSNALQHKQTLRVGVKFDPKGRYSLQTGFGSGSSFASTWEATGVGTGSPSWAFALRTLYGAAQPVTGLELQVGGLAATTRGEATEITTFDNDGYLVGERLSVKRPTAIYLDEVSVTVGFLGDTETPNVFKRLDALDDHNYTQVLAEKKLGGRGGVSADWSRLDGADTWRQAIRLVTKEAKVVDGVRLELYQRVDAPEGEGFAVSLDKALGRAATLVGGYASIDRFYGNLNGDRYGRGRRVFVEGRVNLTPELSVGVFYTHAVNTRFALPNEMRFETFVNYNVVRALQRAGAW